MDNPFLTYTDAGAIAGVSHTTISKWVDLGVLKATPMPGSKLKRIRKQTLLEFLDSLDSDSESSESSASSASSKDG